MKKRIAIISPGNLPIPAIKGGAVESLVDTFLRYIETRDEFEVDVYSVSDDILDEVVIKKGNVRYIQIRKKTPKKVIDRLVRRFRPQYTYNFFVKYVCTKLDCNEYDYVIVENRPTFIYDISKHTKAKIFLHLHNENFIITKKYCKNVPKYCEKIIVVSKYIKGIVEGNMCNANNVVVLYNGIDEKQFKKEKNENKINEIRNKYGLHQDDFVICYTGRFVPEKGVKEVVEAYSQLNDYRNIVLLIIGSSWFGSNIETDYISAVRKISSNCSNRIIFTGYIDNYEVAEIESVSDIAILPSLWNDPLPLTIIEAMACGLPVITTNTGGIPEMCTNDTGVILQNDSELVKSIEIAVCKLAEDSNMRRRLGDNGRKRVEDMFTADSYGRNFINILIEK